MQSGEAERGVVQSKATKLVVLRFRLGYEHEEDLLAWIIVSLGFGNDLPHFLWFPTAERIVSGDRKTKEQMAKVMAHEMQRLSDAEAFASDPDKIVRLFREFLESVGKAGGPQQIAEAVMRFHQAFVSRNPKASGKRPGGIEIDNEGTFRNVMIELDADYLLSHLPENARIRLGQMTDEWSAHSLE